MIRACPNCGASNRVPAERLGDAPKCGRCKTAMGLPNAPFEIDTAGEFDALTSGSPLPVLVDFWAAWCGPCRVVSPEVAKLAHQYQGRVIVAKVNTDRLQNVAARFGIRSIPTLILFRGGEEAKRVSGAMTAAQLAAQLAL